MIAVLLCLCVMTPALAAENNFVPSIGYKDGPEIKKGEMNGEDVTDCLEVTSILQAEKGTTDITPGDRDLLLDVYQDLRKGDMEIPYSDLFAELDSKKMVIRDLFDVSWLCEEHPVYVAPAGITIELTFDLGIGANTDIYVMSYKNNEWTPIVSTVNNGDGTVTCVFEDFCPVAFSVPLNAQDAPAQTGDTANLTLWFVLLSVSAVALVAILVLRRKFIH